MRRSLILGVAIGILAALSAVLSAGAAPAPKSPFVGNWWAVDPVGEEYDLSLAIRGSGYLHVRLVEPLSEECPTGGLLTASGRGEVAGDTLSVRVEGRCHDDRLPMMVDYTLTYNALADEMVDQHSLVWHRR